VNAPFVLSWIVKPSMTTPLALTLIPCELLRIDSAPARVRASTPACAPRSVSVLFTATSPATV
jgi:hypothetical protein